MCFTKNILLINNQIFPTNKLKIKKIFPWCDFQPHIGPSENTGKLMCCINFNTSLEELQINKITYYIYDNKFSKPHVYTPQIHSINCELYEKRKCDIITRQGSEFIYGECSLFKVVVKVNVEYNNKKYTLTSDKINITETS
jgi:hypothetical protein